MFSNFSKFYGFCRQQDAHTSTRHPAKCGGKILTWGLTPAASVGRTSLALLRRPQQQRLLQWLRACTRQSASTGTLLSPQPALPLPFVISYVKHNPNEVYYYTASHRDAFDTLGASGDAQTHTLRFTPAELPHCSIAAGWFVEQRHSTVRRLPVHQVRLLGVGGGYAARLFLLFSFPCSADHGWDWPPCKVLIFFGLATNTSNVKKKQHSDFSLKTTTVYNFQQ